MNRERILQVADEIHTQSLPWLGFQMATYIGQGCFIGGNHSDQTGHRCGTTACIAGWTYLVHYHNFTADNGSAREALQIDPVPAHSFAQNWLELTHDQAMELFGGGPTGYSMSQTQPWMAVNVLRILANTGEVNWDAAVAMGECPRIMKVSAPV